LVKQLKGLKELTPEAVKDMKRLLQEVQKRGGDAVLAIRDFLRSQENVDFDKMIGGKLAAQHTLREALFDILRQMGGDASTAVLAEQLGMTQSPAEIAALARILDEMSPGVYRDEAIRVATNALSALASTKNPLETRPLFELLRGLGGPEAVAILGQYPANSIMVQYLRNPDTSMSPTFRLYALMSLANLPDGEGIPSLAALAADPKVPVESRAAEPYRMLAQASADQADAGQALLYLASTGQIPAQAWAAVADALAGKVLQFPSQSADAGLSGANGRFSRAFYDDQRNLVYEERTLLGSWSTDQIQLQLALIDNLLSITKDPGAVRALQQARATLRNRR
jgi:HEAT repeat protein